MPKLRNSGMRPSAMTPLKHKYLGDCRRAGAGGLSGCVRRVVVLGDSRPAPEEIERARASKLA